jgi:hypothetical protein
MERVNKLKFRWSDWWIVLFGGKASLKNIHYHNIELFKVLMDAYCKGRKSKMENEHLKQWLHGIAIGYICALIDSGKINQINMPYIKRKYAENIDLLMSGKHDRILNDPEEVSQVLKVIN